MHLPIFVYISSQFVFSQITICMDTVYVSVYIRTYVHTCIYCMLSNFVCLACTYMCIMDMNVLCTYVYEIVIDLLHACMKTGIRFAYTCT